MKKAPIVKIRTQGLAENTYTSNGNTWAEAIKFQEMPQPDGVENNN